MNGKRIGKALLFPPVIVMGILTPASIAFLVYAMLALGTDGALTYIAYAFSAYTLTVWCVRIPAILRFFKSFRQENRYARRWLDDERLRVNVSLYGSLIWNSIYAAFLLCLGVYHASFWFYSMGGYYASLALMRVFLVRHTSRHQPGQLVQTELTIYRSCGWIFLAMNLALTLMVFFMVYFNRSFTHHEITTIALAAYTFTAFTVAIVNIVKYRKYKSPAYTASKSISLAAACVSMLTLEATMLTTFGSDTDILTRRIFLGISGGAVSAFIIGMAIYMIVQSTKQLRVLKEKENLHGKQA